MRLACHLGWGGGVTLFSDNAGAIYQGVRGSASVGWWVQQWILRKVNLLLFRHPLVVHFVFVPTFLQPADPISRLEASCGGSRARAFEAARGIWQQLGDNLSYALYIGSVARYVGDALGPIVSLPGELDGGGRGVMGMGDSLAPRGYRDGWSGRVGLFVSWGLREFGFGCRSDPKNLVADAWRQRLTSVLAGFGGLIACGVGWGHHSEAVGGICFCVTPLPFVVSSSTSTVGLALVQ